MIGSILLGLFFLGLMLSIGYGVAQSRITMMGGGAGLILLFTCLWGLAGGLVFPIVIMNLESSFCVAIVFAVSALVFAIVHAVEILAQRRLNNRLHISISAAMIKMFLIMFVPSVMVNLGFTAWFYFDGSIAMAADRDIPTPLPAYERTIFIATGLAWLGSLICAHIFTLPQEDSYFI